VVLVNKLVRRAESKSGRVEAVNDYLCKNKAKAFIVWGAPLYFAIVLTNNQRGRKDILTLDFLLRFVSRQNEE
jgi:hypothetical protein